MSKLAQAPEKGQSAAFLHKASVGGPKVNWVSQASTSTVSFSIGAGSGASVTVNLREFDASLDESLWTDSLALGPSKVQNWAQADIYVDTNNNSNYYIGSGASLTDNQIKISMGVFDQLTPQVTSAGNLYSATTNYIFYNADASPHTIYMSVTARDIQVGN